MNLLAEIRRRFASTLTEFTTDPESYLDLIRPSQDPRFGDFQANLAMSLAKQVGMNPRELAAKIVERLDVAELCETPEVAGPGFINLSILNAVIADGAARMINDDRLGVPQVAKPQRIVIDFSSPNVAKPMHVGHLRSTVIGDALRRILSFLGHDVRSDNHIGDWGTQFGMIIYGYKHFRNQADFERSPLAELSRLYRLVNQLSDYHATVHKLPALKQAVERKQQELTHAEANVDPADKKAAKALRKQRADVDDARAAVRSAEATVASIDADNDLKPLAHAHPEIARDARQETAKLHAGDIDNRQLWDQFLPECLRMLDAIYDRLGISFDMTLGESFYQPLLDDVVEDMQSRGLATESQGALCVFMDGNDAPFMIRKSDGAFTYATTDLATIQYRANEFKSDQMLYVVDARQSEHFRLLFETARLWGFDNVGLRHISFGTILGEDKRPFKTRSGDTVGLESLLDEAVQRARSIVDGNDDTKPDGPELIDAARQRIAECVGLGGIKYADLRHNRDSDYVFSWDKMLATNGDTATYMQYAHARVCGIFRKGDIDRSALRKATGVIRIDAESERALAIQLLKFGSTVEDVTIDYRPNLLTAYLFETANSFSRFYDNCIVLKEVDPDIRASRLLLCDLTARVISRGLALLGIEAPEQM